MRSIYKYNPRQNAVYGIIIALLLMGLPVPAAFIKFKILFLIPFFYSAYIAFKPVNPNVEVSDQQINTPKWKVNKNDLATIRATKTSGRSFYSYGFYFDDKNNNSYCIFGLDYADSGKILEKLKANNYENIQVQY